MANKVRGGSCPRLAGAGIKAEKEASALPWMGKSAPVDKGGEIAPGRKLPFSTIQTDLARAPAAIGHSRVLSPSEDPLLSPEDDQRKTGGRPDDQTTGGQPREDELLQVERVKSHNTRAFIRMASERCRAVILALPDSGNLCKADLISLSTFKVLNRCAIRKMQIDPIQSSQDIRSVTGSSLKIEGRIRGGLTVVLQGSAGTLHLNPLISSNFTGSHLNLSQDTMSRLRIQLQPNTKDGGYFVTQVGKAPLVARGGLYSLNYTESLFKRISIYRHKNGWLHQKLKQTNGKTNKRSWEVGQIALSERRGLKALGMENQILKEPGETSMVLTQDGFLQVPLPGTPKEVPPPTPFDCDPFLAHEELRGMTVEELREYFEGPLDDQGVPQSTPEVAHVSQLTPGQSAFLAPQIGRLKKAITLASGEAATVVTTATLPRDSYIFVEELANKNNSNTLEGLHITQAISLCLDGKSVVCIATNRTIGTLSVGVNSPICQLSVVRPDFESAVLKQQQDRFASPASPVCGPGPRPPRPAPQAPDSRPPPSPCPPPLPEKKLTKRRKKEKK